MLKFPCLILDHDDTVVQSEATVNYPCFCRFLEQYRPGTEFTFPDYVDGCSHMTFIGMCKSRFSMTDEELNQEYQFWQDYARTHIPTAFPGIGKLLQTYRNAGGLICVVSMSAEEQILRDYRHHFGFVPDHVFGCDLPEAQRKPSPWALMQIQKQYGLSPRQMLVVDDMKFAVSMARQAGCPIAFSGWGRKDFPSICKEMEALCDYSFYSIKQFADFLFE